MFGKPEWFQVRETSSKLRPVVFQGWAYTGVWTGVILLPAVALLSRGLVVESLIWVGAMMLGMRRDVRQIRRDLQGPAAEASEAQLAKTENQDQRKPRRKYRVATSQDEDVLYIA